jgi:hypothetical protein
MDVCVVCVLYSKGKNQDDQNKRVWMKYKERTRELKSPVRGHGHPTGCDVPLCVI